MEFNGKLSWLTKYASRKVWIILLIILLFIFSLFRFWSASDREKPIEQIKPVKIREVKEETRIETLEYLGVINAREVKKVGFKMSGVLEKVFVSIGDPIEKEDILAQLESEEIGLAAEAAENNRNNAKKAYEFAQDNYIKMGKLLEAGAVSQQEYDKAEVELENLKTLYYNAEIDYQNKLNIFEDTVLKADISGYSADVLYEEGEIVPSGYPVIIIRGRELELNIGLVQNDVEKVRIGTTAQIYSAGLEVTGIVSSVGQLPDPVTKTYPTILKIEGSALTIGSTVKANLNIGIEKGIFIPINTVKNDGQDYVYVIDQDMIAHKKLVKLGRIRSTEVMVSGLSEGDKLVIEGIKRLNEGDKVSFQP